jgi:hypothetical protein
LLYRGTRRFALVLAAAGFAAACRDVTSMFGRGSPKTDGQRRGEQLFRALHARVTLPHRTPIFDSARTKIANAAFLPGRVWKDTAMWTEHSRTRRLLAVHGRFADGRYVLDAVPGVLPPDELAESRHLIALRRIADGEYAWDTDVTYAIGSVTAGDIARFLSALWAGAERQAEPEIREAVRAEAPRSTAVLAQLFHVDSIRTTHLADRSTLATFAATLTPAGVETRYPHFARYMRRYGETSRIRLVLADARGGTFFEGSLLAGKMLLRVRTLDGALVPLAGPARPMPDTLAITGGLAIKVRRFTVGFENYRGEFVISRSDHERSWTIVSRTEPDWVLPLFTETLLRTPLRRPFQGDGASFTIGVKDQPGAQTVLGRWLHVEVKESAILRFIGRLGAIAVADFSGDAEREQYAWLEEFFGALLEDLKNQNAADP